jgi:TonB family protein
MAGAGLCRPAALLILAALTPATAVPRMPEPGKAFGYVGPQIIITAETSGEHKFVLNFFNLSDYVIVVQPSEFICKGASGRFYIGQVFDQPTTNTRGETYRYSASFLLHAYSFQGLDLLGVFREQDQIEELSMRIGSRRYYLKPLLKGEFEELGERIGDLELKSPDPRAALRRANIAEMGRVTSTDGTSDWDRDWQDLIMPDGTNPTRILEGPEVSPTEEARRTGTYGKVQLSAVITRDGTIQDLAVVKGLGHGLDERAIEAVKTSWTFLPATKNGEVVVTTVKFSVTFSPPKSAAGRAG